MTPAAGALDRRVELLRPRVERGPAGDERRVGWAVVDEAWAGRDDVAGREFVRAGQRLAQRTCRFRIRWRPGVDQLAAVREADGTVWEVLGVAELGRRAGLELTCEHSKGTT